LNSFGSTWQNRQKQNVVFTKEYHPRAILSIIQNHFFYFIYFNGRKIEISPLFGLTVIFCHVILVETSETFSRNLCRFSALPAWIRETWNPQLGENGGKCVRFKGVFGRLFRFTAALLCGKIVGKCGHGPKGP
jgi:hypothetical protein